MAAVEERWCCDAGCQAASRSPRHAVL
jgi:hypothetical protein